MVFWNRVFGTLLTALVLALIMKVSIDSPKHDQQQAQLYALQTEVYSRGIDQRWPSAESTGWAIRKYGEVMSGYESRPGNVGFGTLGDYAYPLLRHIVKGYEIGYVSKEQAEAALQRMQKYAGTEDTYSTQALAMLKQRVEERTAR